MNEGFIANNHGLHPAVMTTNGLGALAANNHGLQAVAMTIDELGALAQIFDTVMLIFLSILNNSM